MSETLAAAALRYARALGWHVFPIDPQTKRPMFRHPLWDGDEADCPADHCIRGRCGHHHASNDPDTVKTWWEKHPDHWIGVSCASSGLVVVDVDTDRGGRTPEGLHPTWTERTRGGGLHFYYLAPDGAEFSKELAPGVDLKHNGYVVASPSPGYRWLLGIGPVAKWQGRTYKASPAFPGPRVGEYTGPEDITPAGAEYLRPAGERLMRTLEAGTGRNGALFFLARTAGQLVAGGEAKQAPVIAWLNDLGKRYSIDGYKGTIKSGYLKGSTKDRPISLKGRTRITAERKA